ncbi:CatB-related O-acetyltransferase [Nocardioides dubius]|uniref:CatB-related O-acetyltransferase n=1 Tax=Nocardioides dubius TaxID=317019 RepID=A0ABN1U489_9ACTN
MVRSFLRFVYYLLRRIRDEAIGAHIAEFKRMEKAGRVTVGPNTRAYQVPMIKSFIHDDTKLTLGDYSSLSSEAMVYLGGKHKIDAVTTYPHRILWGMEGAGEDGFPTPTGDTFIGSDVWLCPGSHVISGVRIGHGAIIGAGSVITRDVPDYAVVGGNPAKVIRYRFSEEQIAALLEIRWWDWPRAEVEKAVPYLASQDIDAFIAYARDLLARRPDVLPPATPEPRRTEAEHIAEALARNGG